jgi:hypothetical protein
MSPLSEGDLPAACSNPFMRYFMFAAVVERVLDGERTSTAVCSDGLGRAVLQFYGNDIGNGVQSLNEYLACNLPRRRSSEIGKIVESVKGKLSDSSSRAGA